MKNDIIESVVSKEVGKILTETTRRQKAIRGFLGKNNKVKTFGIITAENPMGISYGSKENKDRNMELRMFLASRQYLFFPAKGKYGNVEHPFLIYNISLDDMKLIGKKFDQESFIYAEVDNSGEQPHVVFSYFAKEYSEAAEADANGNPIKPSQREYKFIESKDIYTGLDSETSDYFTALGRNFKFSIPFDIFNEAIEKYNNFVNERCEKHQEYKALFGKRLDESIQSGRVGRSRRLARARLYGKNYEKFL